VKSVLDDHALDDGDTYIVVSKRQGQDQATIHIHGELADLGELLELVELAMLDPVMDSETIH